MDTESKCNLTLHTIAETANNATDTDRKAGADHVVEKNEESWQIHVDDLILLYYA